MHEININRGLYTYYRIKSKVKSNFYLELTLVFIALFMIGVVGMYIFEKGVNDNFSSLLQSAWSGIVYTFSGFEDRSPITTGGKAFSIFIFISSMVILGGAVGKISANFILKKELKMPKDVMEHIAVCNWNDGGDRIIRELHAIEAEPQTEIVVVTHKNIDEESLRKSPAYEKVYFVRSDPTIHDVLRASRVHFAKTVVILADMDSHDPDAQSTLIALAVNKLCEMASRPKPHIVAEAINHRKVEHLKDAGVDEVICETDYGLGLLAQCALHRNLSHVYERLLTYTINTNEIYMVEAGKYPKSFIGKTFPEVSDILNKNRDKDNPAILVGVCRNGQVILNPKKNFKESTGQFFKNFEEGDTLIVMSYNPPDLQRPVFKE